VIQGWRTPEDNPFGYQDPSQQQLKYEDVRLTTADGLLLHGWFIPAPKAYSVAIDGAVAGATILFCHENAGNIGLRASEYKLVHHKLRVNQFVFDYRGYGHSQGTPSEHGLVTDTMTAFEWLQSKVDPTKIVLAGRSLGGAVAVAAAAKIARSNFYGATGPVGLIIENSFTSISDMVDSKFPFLNVPFFKPLFLRLKWDSRSAIRALELPMLFLSSTRDEIVPAEQMEALRDAAINAKSRSFSSFNATHNDIWAAGGEEYWQAKRAFLERVLA
jgi:fermentation-respiration switch protein FrsA (DUF1100 family)